MVCQINTLVVLRPTPSKSIGVQPASNLTLWALESAEIHLQEWHNFAKCTNIIIILLPSQCCHGENSVSGRNSVNALKDTREGSLETIYL